ncbi:MAG: hypothetical protein AAF399_22405 [Bacteroidota bacterium]
MIAPCLVLLAYWYRKQFSQTLMVWKNPEMVILTITFSIVGLILFIVATSSFFTYFNVLQPSNIHPPNQEKFLTIGIICSALMVATVLIYLAMRMLLVRIITEQGIVANHSLLRIPNFRRVIEWGSVSDYYLVSDYPSVVVTLIIQKQAFQYERVSLKVPVYLRDDFEDLLEAKMYHAQAVQSQSGIEHRYLGN